MQNCLERRRTSLGSCKVMFLPVSLAKAMGLKVQVGLFPTAVPVGFQSLGVGPETGTELGQYHL